MNTYSIVYPYRIDAIFVSAISYVILAYKTKHIVKTCAYPGGLYCIWIFSIRCHRIGAEIVFAGFILLLIGLPLWHAIMKMQNSQSTINL